MFELSEATSLLRRTPAVLSALLHDLPDAWSSANEGFNTWSARDVLAHVAELERSDWPVRLRVIMQEGPTGTFATVDRVRFKSTFIDTPIAGLLDVFSKQREANLR